MYYIDISENSENRKYDITLVNRYETVKFGFVSPLP